MTFDKLRTARMAARKRGADMTNALLWAAFAIGVLIALFGVAWVANNNSNKNTASQVVSTASAEARTLFRNSSDFTGVSNTVLINSGGVPTTAIDGTDIVLPYGTTVAFAPATDPTKFTATVTTADTRGGRALCTFLSSGDKGSVISGPMGAEYTIAAAVDCSAAGSVVATYER